MYHIIKFAEVNAMARDNILVVKLYKKSLPTKLYIHT